ncbi:puromycin-sensitive aminopeptidase-like protein isoform X2 [Nilaparvata lugens]|uniref:puromycin-sensitive aminopeptidase-like protein isoform X2 n=1 Tax=Nilaparvata lugens TaxID=108931 RepID=UPI00193D8D92|nr:puromycin-sensitive aminopeptidase-like protein isoform X2 [Nilaparvata lugens]
MFEFKFSLFLTILSVSWAWDIPNYMDKPTIYADDISVSNLPHNELVGENRYRLPDVIKPLGYDLKIVPELDNNNFSFTGDLTIRINILNTTDEIVLNSHQLHFHKSSINITLDDSPIGQVYRIDLANLTFDPFYQQAIIKTIQPLRQGIEYHLKIKYEGVLTTRMLGFYRSWYYLGNETRWLGSTQFESTFARSAFPCFDEPRFRSTFKLSIARDGSRSTISNMPLESTSNPDPAIGNRVWDIYEESPPMATYLFAFSIFDFAKITDNSTGRVNVYAQNISIAEGEFIVNEAPTILDVLGNYTNLTFPLTKIDIVAVPDFNAGAMENWGMTTYREKYVLFKDNVSTTLDKQWILSIVAHEFAHQWFGDLVTPSWWDYTWLNEGFATYFEYYVPSVMRPEWRMLDQFVVRELQPALAADEGSSHPINANVSSPSEIDAIFDVISYNKAGSVLRMIKHFLGELYYRKGLQHYLRHALIHDSGTVKPNTLWHGLESKLPSELLPNGTSLRQVVSTWVDQDGFPLLTVTRKNRSIIIEQSAYSRTLTRDGRVNEEKAWWVPLTFTTDKELNFTDTTTKAWLGPQKSVEIKMGDALQWIIFNIQQTGYYRVNYDLESWMSLASTLSTNHTSIHPINRAHLLDDAFTLATSGKVDYEIPLKLSAYLVEEDDFIPWFVAIKHYGGLIRRFRDNKVGEHLKKTYTSFVQTAYNKLSAINEQNRTYSERLAASSLFPQACMLGIEECQSKYLKDFADWLHAVSNQSHPAPAFDPDTKYTTLCTGVRAGNHSVWEAVWNYYVKTDISTEKSLLLQVLGCSQNSSSLKT